MNKAMKIGNIYSLVLAAAIASSFFCAAQDLSTEVVVDRTVETYLPEAKPLKNVYPQVFQNPLPDLTLKPADYRLWSEFNPLVRTGIAPDYTGLAAPDKHRGYLWLGYFPTYNLGVAAGYRLIDKERTRAGASLNFDGYSYNNRFSDTGVRSNAFKINAYVEHLLKTGLKFGVYGGYGFDGLKNPGTYKDYDKQAINNANLQVKVSRHTDRISYYGDLYLRYFGLGKDITPQIHSMHEELVRLRAGILAPVSSVIKVGADGAIDVLRSSDKMALGTLTPKAVFSGKDYEVSIGLRFDLTMSAPGDKFHLSPRVSALWNFMPQASLYGKFNGGTRLTTLYSLYCYSPFAPGSFSSRPSYCPVDALVGIRLGAFGGFKFDISAGYAKENSAPMPVAAKDGDYSTMKFESLGESGFNAAFSVAYSYSTLVDASVRFGIGPEGLGMENGNYFDRAKYNLTVNAAFRPVDKWKIDLRYNLRAKRRYAVAGDTKTECSMGSLSDLGAGVTWNMRENLSFFLRVDNILNSRPLVLPGLSYNGFHGLLGVDLRF